MRVAQYQTACIFGAALLLGIMLKGKNDAAHWAAFSLVFAFVSAYAGSMSMADEVPHAVRGGATVVGLVTLALAVACALAATALFVS